MEESGVWLTDLGWRVQADGTRWGPRPAVYSNYDGAFISASYNKPKNAIFIPVKQWNEAMKNLYDALKEK